MRELSDLSRRLENLIRIGLVVDADYSSARLKVEISGRPTGWLPWATMRAGGDIDWRAPEIGEQVLVLAISGDPANGVVVGSLFQNSAPAPASSADISRIVFGDGMVIEHDRANRTTRIDAKTSGGMVLVDASDVTVSANDISLQGGDILIEGDTVTVRTPPNAFQTEETL